MGFMILAIIAGMPRARFKAAVLTTTKQLSPSAVESRWALHPGRGYQQSDPSYKSKFQRYSELILTAVAEPWTQRHSSDLEYMRRRANETRARGVPGRGAGGLFARLWRSNSNCNLHGVVAIVNTKFNRRRSAGEAVPACILQPYFDCFTR
jgi:hypothetical protein